MILYSIVLFCLAAALGLSIVVLGLRYKRGSLTLALGHAAVAVLALGLLMNQILGDGPSHILYNTAALLFFLTLFGGLVLLAVRITKRERRAPPPMFVVGLHAVMALIGLLLLVVGYARY
jgi:peptidoglycan/LPS O-acetylase OafA/YrhL